MGHALFATIQDITIRHKRMQGYRTLWLAGTDHAGLATQAKLDEAMIAEGLDPLGPDFDAFAATYKANLANTITTQLKSCGASADWSRERFTLDERYAESTIEALRRCHGAGMLYEADGQWWLDMRDLSARLLTEMDAGELEIIPSGQEGTLRNFLTKIEPWCISRQIRWGHKLPIWKNGEQIIIGEHRPADGFEQEDGCLDTWFSSSLWPFASLGWPHDTADMRDFYPAAMIETADDILFFWCARMLMMGLLLTDQMPFKKIFLHGLVRDKHGKKMSKSEGNGIDPLEIIDQYGADAMRFALAENATAGQDMRLDPIRFQAGKAMSTKLWNASKYALGHSRRMGDANLALQSDHADDIEILSRLESTRTMIGNHLEAHRYHEAAHALRRFLFDDFCSWYIEVSKSRLYDDNDAKAHSTIMQTLDGFLRMAHPYMPFITEHIRSAYSSTPLITDRW